MRLFVGVTDFDWFQLHAANAGVEEVNFWKPSPDATFKALQPGEPFLFKLHAPRNFIAGGGFFAKFLTLPVGLAWEAFGEANGARSLVEVKQRISKYRRVAIGPHDNPDIGCIPGRAGSFSASPSGFYRHPTSRRTSWRDGGITRTRELATNSRSAIRISRASPASANPHPLAMRRPLPSISTKPVSGSLGSSSFTRTNCAGASDLRR
jgi:hypothetical protein